MDIEKFIFFLLNLRMLKIQSVVITRKLWNCQNTLKTSVISKVYFVKSELLTPACSHFLTMGLRNDMGRAVKTANETTSIKSVVKWFIPKSVPESQSQGNADANKIDSIDSAHFQS